MKAAVVCLLVVVVSAVAVEAGFVNQTRIIGTIGPGDRVLSLDVARKPAKRNMVSVADYKYPVYGHGYTINCIRVFDRWLNGSNGNLFINSGGVGHNSVSLSIRSLLGYGLHYNIQLWGH